MKTRLEPRPYRIGDCLLFDVQAAQAADMAPETFSRLATAPPPGVAWTFWRGHEPIACGGIMADGRRNEAWALIASRARLKDRLELIDFARQALDRAPLRRIEAYARGGWDRACRALEALGFEKEGVLRSAAWDGEDLHLFARIK